MQRNLPGDLKSPGIWILWRVVRRLKVVQKLHLFFGFACFEAVKMKGTEMKRTGDMVSQNRLEPVEELLTIIFQ